MSSVVSVKKLLHNPLFTGAQFKLEDIEGMQDVGDPPWFKRAHLGAFLELEDIRTFTRTLDSLEEKSREELLVEGGRPTWHGGLVWT